MRRTLKWALGLLVINTLVWAVGQAITRSKTSADLSADEVELYTFWNSPAFVPRSASLRRVKARVLMAGATIDLREAQPSEDGTVVDVSTLMGGTAVLVPKDWDVEVIEETRASEVEVRLDTGAEIPTDSPKVTVHLRTTLGGALVGYELPADMDA
jgi:hypothetical protein